MSYIKGLLVKYRAGCIVAIVLIIYKGKIALL